MKEHNSLGNKSKPRCIVYSHIHPDSHYYDYESHPNVSITSESDILDLYSHQTHLYTHQSAIVTKPLLFNKGILIYNLYENLAENEDENASHIKVDIGEWIGFFEIQTSDESCNSIEKALADVSRQPFVDKGGEIDFDELEMPIIFERDKQCISDVEVLRDAILISVVPNENAEAGEAGAEKAEAGEAGAEKAEAGEAGAEKAEAGAETTEDMSISMVDEMGSKATSCTKSEVEIEGEMGKGNGGEYDGGRALCGGRLRLSSMQKKRTEKEMCYARPKKWLMYYLLSVSNRDGVPHDSNGGVELRAVLPSFEVVTNGKLGDSDSLYISIARALDDMYSDETDHDNENNDSPKDRGNRTSMDMRSFVADGLTQEMFEYYLDGYRSSQAQLQAINANIREINQSARAIKGELDTISTNTANRARYVELMKEAKRLKTLYRQLKIQRDNIRVEAMHFSFMKGVSSLGKLKRTILEATFHGNDEFLAILERKYNIKTIIFDKDAYDARDIDNVVQCGSKLFVRGGHVFEPTHYVLLEKSGDGLIYDNICFKRRYTHELDDIPEAIVRMIVDRIIEGNGGEYANIPDFGRLVHRRGSAGVCTRTRSLDASVDSSVILYVHANAPTNKVMAGRWLKERMPLERLVDFYELNDTHNKCWRQVLSNDWTAWFGVKEFDRSSLSVSSLSTAVLSVRRDLVGKRMGRIYAESSTRIMHFISVTHYLLYKEFPELCVKRDNGACYSVFEKDSGEPSCYTVHAAHSYASLARGSANDGGLEEDNDLVSVTYEDEVRANISKFLDPENADLKKALLATKNAMVYSFRPGKATVPFYALMEARSRIREAKATISCEI